MNPHYGTPAIRPTANGAGGSPPAPPSSLVRRHVRDLYRLRHRRLGTRAAAFCGVTGFKPTQSRVPRTGAMALSLTLDRWGR